MDARYRIGRVGVVGVVALVFSASGCGKIAEKAVEKSTEKAIEQQTGGQADVDAKTGKIKVTDNEGSTFEVDGNGNVKVTGKDGETQVLSRSDAKVPDGWPAALRPAGMKKILQATESSTDGGKLLSITAEFESSVTSTHRAFKARLDDAGYQTSSDTSGQRDGEDYANLVASDDTRSVVAGFGTDGNGTTVATISITPAL